MPEEEQSPITPEIYIDDGDLQLENYPGGAGKVFIKSTSRRSDSVGLSVVVDEGDRSVEVSIQMEPEAAEDVAALLKEVAIAEQGYKEE